ncbi:MAG: RNA polymerase sigma factor [Deltaproteobacteria bacterium]
MKAEVGKAGEEGAAKAAAPADPSGSAPARRKRRRPVDPEKEARDKDDARLMTAFKKGDARAFEKLLERHRRPVYNFCLKMVGNPAAAEDAMQEVFLRVCRSAKDWERQAKFTTWLYTIARNHCIDAIRKASYRKTASLDQPLKEGEEGGSTLGDRMADEDSVTTDRGAESIRLRKRLTDAIASLSDEQREVFVMREQAGMAFKEIADAVGVPENTVKSRMRYALEHLRKHLKTQGVTKED